MVPNGGEMHKTNFFFHFDLKNSLRNRFLKSDSKGQNQQYMENKTRHTVLNGEENHSWAKKNFCGCRIFDGSVLKKHISE